LGPSDQQVDRVVALAGAFQAACLVQQVARQGSPESASYGASIASVLVTDAESTAEVYGGLAGVHLGLELLGRQFWRRGGQMDMEVLRYVIGLTYLERKLSRQRNLLDDISAGIQRAKSQAELYGATHDNVIANLAGLYSDSVSLLGPRILVHGDRRYLDNPRNAERIRALLLAGIRSVVLWRQKGGTRPQLILSRRAILRTCQSLLAALQNDRLQDG
jgi:high frequency lysogenization protein